MTKGGLVVYGAFFGGVAGLLLFVRKHRLPLLAICDLIAPSMVLGLAIGRIGCLLNGCCFGAVCDHPWAITFPARQPRPIVAQVERGQMYGFTLERQSGEPSRACWPSIPTRRPVSAGLKPGDRLQRINGGEIAATGDAYAALEQAFTEQPPAASSSSTAGRRSPLPAIAPPPRSLPVHPTQIYSAIDGLLLCLLLLAYDPLPPPRRRGVRADDVDLSRSRDSSSRACGATRRPSSARA